MTAQTQVPGTTAIYSPAQPMRERTAWYIKGPLLLLGDLVVLIVAAILFWQGAVHSGALKTVLIVIGIVLAVVFLILFRGIRIVSPGRAHGVQFFGNYKGRIREPGMQWVNPFSDRIQVSTRIRNLETGHCKGNDADGTPSEM